MPLSMRSSTGRHSADDGWRAGDQHLWADVGEQEWPLLFGEALDRARVKLDPVGEVIELGVFTRGRGRLGIDVGHHDLA